MPAKVAALIEHELALIVELRYEAFFLTVWDLVEFARARGILCQGRGSAANSAVCYCLDITAVDPDRSDVLFERFVSRERNEPPDIDVDFEHERREEVLQYIYAKYGRDRAGIAAEVICYRPRSAVRDVGKALGMSSTLPPTPAADRPRGCTHDPAACRPRAWDDIDLINTTSGELAHLANEILGFPRHLSQHVGGFVITQGPLAELVPIENAAMPGRTVIEWDKDDLDALGMLKVDCLALGMLTCIRKSFDLIARHHAVHLTLADVPAEDPAVYDMMCKADTVGVFQIESRAQMSMLPRLQPRCFYDLVIEVAIVRPGPIQGNMVHPYLRRRAGDEPVTYPDPAIEEVLHKTLGVPLFQEQVMRLAMVAAGFTPGEADQLRRAMAAWKRPGEIERFRNRIREGLLARGLPEEFAARLFEQIRGFADYGFPESHAASFALLAYVSAWLKCHYPAAFAAALLNSQPMGFYAPAQIVGDLCRHDVMVRPVDVNLSDWDCTLEKVSGERRGVSPPVETPTGGLTPRRSPGTFSMRLGFRLIKGFAHAAALALHEARRRLLPLGAGRGTPRRVEPAAARTTGGGRCVRLARPRSAHRAVARAARRRGLAALRRPGRRRGLPEPADAGAGRAGGRRLRHGRPIAQGAPDELPAHRAGRRRHPHRRRPGPRPRQDDRQGRRPGHHAAAAIDRERNGLRDAGGRDGEREPDRLEAHLGPLSRRGECRGGAAGRGRPPARPRRRHARGRQPHRGFVATSCGR